MSKLYGVLRYMVVMMGIIMVVLVGVTGNSIGANWGTQATHPLDADIVVQMLKDNGIQKVKLFEPDVDALKALGKSGIEVMVGIPNDLLASLSSSVSAAENWVARNLSSYVSSSGVNVRYVAVGNEPFLKTLNGTYDAMTLPALQNIQSALIKAGLANRVKVTIPLNADVYESSSLPSGGDFRSDIKDLMVQIIKFLNDNVCAVTINIYPFISLYNDPNFPTDYAFFDGFSSPLDDNGKTYTNVFDANYDTLLWSLEKNGFGNMSVIVGEIGWPTDGDKNANPTNARRFNQGLVNHIAQGKGTPMRPTGPIDAYLFSLIDEDDKSILPGNFERHWGFFNYDGTPKYQLNLGLIKSGSTLIPAKGVQYLAKKWCVMSPSANLNDPQIAPSVSYACGNADCTSLGYGTSCANLDVLGNVSYAYNSYYQEKNQLDNACKFPDGLSFITTKDPSVGTCRFIIQIKSETRSGSKSGSLSSGYGSGTATVRTSASFLFLLLIILMTL